MLFFHFFSWKFHNRFSDWASNACSRVVRCCIIISPNDNNWVMNRFAGKGFLWSFQFRTVLNIMLVQIFVSTFFYQLPSILLLRPDLDHRFHSPPSPLPRHLLSSSLFFVFSHFSSSGNGVFVLIFWDSGV